MILGKSIQDILIALTKTLKPDSIRSFEGVVGITNGEYVVSDGFALLRYYHRAIETDRDKTIQKNMLESGIKFPNYLGVFPKEVAKKTALDDKQIKVFRALLASFKLSKETDKVIMSIDATGRATLAMDMAIGDCVYIRNLIRYLPAIDKKIYNLLSVEVYNSDCFLLRYGISDNTKNNTFEYLVCTMRKVE